jgi:hypothetical protein
MEKEKIAREHRNLFSIQIPTIEFLETQPEQEAKTRSSIEEFVWAWQPDEDAQTWREEFAAALQEAIVKFSVWQRNRLKEMCISVTGSNP